MSGLNLLPNAPHRKCARVVGEVLGKFHPHGDVAVYDALVRMAQNFATNTPLIDGHGNFGSIDNDPAAAMRYTECRLTQVAHQALLQDLDSDTVDYTPNFDGNEIEPLVLPAKLPFLLLNGASGIAVGMATQIPVSLEVATIYSSSSSKLSLLLIRVPTIIAAYSRTIRFIKLQINV